MTAPASRRAWSDLAWLPWPFEPQERSFRYSVNVEPARREVRTAAGSWGRHVVHLTDDYEDLMRQRQEVLAASPQRFAAPPGTEPAGWDMLLWLLGELASSYPDVMHLRQDGPDVHWRNDRLGVEAGFRIGDRASLGEHPLLFVGRQVPDDLIVMHDRQGSLWFDAALVTFAGTWSVGFDVGMPLEEIHAPVPRLNSTGVTARGIAFMRGLRPGQVYRRVNWNTSAHGSPLRDTSLEAKPTWDDDLPALVARGEWERYQLRIEVEHLTRLPRSNALTFNIRTYTAPFGEIVTVPGWGGQLADVIEELPQDIAGYKGLADIRDRLVPWLRERAVT